MKWLLSAIAIFVVGYSLTYVAIARGAYQDQRLNAVASSVAGHPVIVSCATSVHEWATFEDQAGYTFETDGFTFIGRTPSVVFLAPRVCDTLEADLDGGPTLVGPYWLGLAIKVILHEATHQTGLADEGATDCKALALVKQYAVSSFRVPATVVQTSYKRVNRIIGGHAVYVRVTKTVPNPMLAAIYASALRWHKMLPASYQGGC